METKEYQLPKDFATKWVESLRSGNYKQSQQSLYNDGGYCCLGVACIIQGIDKMDIYGQTYPSINVLPFAYENDLMYKVAKLNDHDGYSFSDIANWIEQNVEFI